MLLRCCCVSKNSERFDGTAAPKRRCLRPLPTLQIKFDALANVVALLLLLLR
jgi:hypothetical protein